MPKTCPWPFQLTSPLNRHTTGSKATVPPPQNCTACFPPFQNAPSTRGYPLQNRGRQMEIFLHSPPKFNERFHTLLLNVVAKESCQTPSRRLTSLCPSPFLSMHVRHSAAQSSEKPTYAAVLLASIFNAENHLLPMAFAVIPAFSGVIVTR